MLLEKEYPKRPLVGVGAVIMDVNHILLIKRSQEPGKGKWSVPGGLVELGEDVRAAAKREIEEEVGLKIIVKDLLGVFDYVQRDVKNNVQFHYVLIDFLAERENQELKLNREVSQTLWVTVEDALSLDLTDTTRELLNCMNINPQ